MRRLALLTLALSAVAACDSPGKLGFAGATCRSSSDCERDLQCVASTCTGPANDACAAKDAEHKQAMDALLAELDALKAEQKQLEAEKTALDARLGALVDPGEKARLLAEKALLDAQLAEQAKTQGKRPRAEPQVVKKKVGDPLAGP